MYKLLIILSLLAITVGQTKSEVNSPFLSDLNRLTFGSDSLENFRGPNCVLCKRIVKELFEFLKDNRTEESIRYALEEICPVFFSNKDKLKQCQEFMDTYTKELVDLLVQETDPELICMMLDQCVYINKSIKSKPIKAINREPTIQIKANKPTSMSEFISMLDPSIPVGSTGTCIECKIFIKYLQTTFKNPESQEKIKDWLLENLCDNLDEVNMKGSCRQLVENNSKAFFEAIVTDLDPRTVCIELGSCKKNRLLFDTLLMPMKDYSQTIQTIEPTVLDFRRRTVRPSQIEQFSAKPQPITSKPQPISGAKDIFKKVGDGICDQCIDIVTQLDQYLSKHSIDHDVDVLVDQVCNKLPSENIKQECTVVVRTLGDNIVQLISSMSNPRELCSKIYLC